MRRSAPLPHMTLTDLPEGRHTLGWWASSLPKMILPEIRPSR